MINYTIKALANPQDRDEVKYYPQIVITLLQMLDSIIKRIKSRTRLISSDIRAVVDALEYELIDAHGRGETVCLGNIGTFRPSISADGTSTAKEACSGGANLIRKLNVNYKMSAGMAGSLQLSNLEFSPLHYVANETDVD